MNDPEEIEEDDEYEPGKIVASYPRTSLHQAVGVRAPKIYLQKLPATAWQLLWWLLCEMDGCQEVRGGWRVRAAIAMNMDRVIVSRGGIRLFEAGLIDTEKNARWVRVIARNITG